MILEAQYWLRQENYDKARSLVEAASKEDQNNAEAWFLLGLDRDLSGDTAAAVDHYRRAVEAAPESPQYRSNLARGLLELVLPGRNPSSVRRSTAAPCKST